MRAGTGVAAVVFAAALSVVAAQAAVETEQVGARLSIAEERALAGPDGPGRGAAPDTSATAAPDQSRPARFLLFSTTDIWRQGGFTYGGVLWSPQDVDGEGLVVKLIFGGGLYRYVSGALGNTQVIGRQLSAAVLPGWRFVRNGWTVTIFAGPEYQNHKLNPDDASAGLRGSYAGARTGFDLWFEPTAMTMITADASISTIGVSYSARLAAGWRLFDMFYLGPEVATFAADKNYRQYRAGLHVTGLRFGAFEWSAGLGWATDSDKWSSVYGKLSVLTRR